MKSLKSQNYYEVLNISRYASQEDIRKAFEICKNTFQAGSLATYSLYSDEENQEIFELISKAYETLRNPAMRRDYDSFLSGSESPPGQDGWEEEKLTASMIGVNDGRAGSDNPDEPIKAIVTGGKSSGPAMSGNNISSLHKATEPNTRVDEFLKSVESYSGAVLAKVRNLKGLSLDDLAELTKIRKTYIQYIEEENFEFLPAPVYIKGFVIIVSNTLGLPAQQVAIEYMKNYHQKTGTPYPS